MEQMVRCEDVRQGTPVLELIREAEVNRAVPDLDEKRSDAERNQKS